MAAPELLVVPEAVWLETRRLIEAYTPRRLEMGLYWYGVRTSEAAVACVPGIPHQTNRPRNFEVHADDLAILVRHIPDPLVAVAQIHIHPGVDTSHSSWDDTWAVSTKILSLVLPLYGSNAHLAEAAVHEYQDKWVRISDKEARVRVVLLPGLIDTRR